MKRFMKVVLLLTSMVSCVAACQKAHEAGNDSMKAGGGKMDVAASAPANGASSGPRQ
jgi:hypothetical protein